MRPRLRQFERRLVTRVLGLLQAWQWRLYRWQGRIEQHLLGETSAFTDTGPAGQEPTGEAPAHWVDLVRRRAPWLLRRPPLHGVAERQPNLGPTSPRESTPARRRGESGGRTEEVASMPARHDRVSAETAARPVAGVVNVRDRGRGAARQGDPVHSGVQGIQARADLPPVDDTARRHQTVHKTESAKDAADAVVVSAGGAQADVSPAAATGVVRHAPPHDAARTKDRMAASVANRRDALPRSPVKPVDAMASGHEAGDRPEGKISRGEALDGSRTQKGHSAGSADAREQVSYTGRQAMSQEAVAAQQPRSRRAGAVAQGHSEVDEVLLRPPWPRLPDETDGTEDRRGSWPVLPKETREHEGHDGNGWLQRHRSRLRREQEGVAWRG